VIAVRSRDPLSRRRAALAVLWTGACGPLVALLLQVPGGAWWALGGYLGGCAAAGGLAGRVPWGSRNARRASLLALATGALTALGVRLLRAYLPDPSATWAAWGLAGEARLPWLATYVLVNPVLEERFWRGALLAPGMRHRIGDRAARALAVLGFGGHHAVVLVTSWGWALGLALVPAVLVAAAVWARWVLTRGGIGDSWASHLGADVGLVVGFWPDVLP
jgi:hypothetical protein